MELTFAARPLPRPAAAGARRCAPGAPRDLFCRRHRDHPTACARCSRSPASAASSARARCRSRRGAQYTTSASHHQALLWKCPPWRGSVLLHASRTPQSGRQEHQLWRPGSRNSHSGQTRLCQAGTRISPAQAGRVTRLLPCPGAVAFPSCGCHRSARRLSSGRAPAPAPIPDPGRRRDPGRRPDPGRRLFCGRGRVLGHRHHHRHRLDRRLLFGRRRHPSPRN
mmetsp:Transcript_45369/g.130119  ORF Transcript_45369/g.130119 Transcript_45369/m.130119 type:complete len:224 (+) Transcript_45369:93-764(+)